MWSFVFYALKFTTRAHFRARIRIHEEHTHLPCRPNLYVCNKQLNVRVRTSPPAKTTHTKNIKKTRTMYGMDYFERRQISPLIFRLTFIKITIFLRKNWWRNVDIRQQSGWGRSARRNYSHLFIQI